MVARRAHLLGWVSATRTGLLVPVYRRFTEGFETADLVAARTLLASVR
jgi:hypothetical protein